jgi:membrane-bound ClpP family serine protease
MLTWIIIISLLLIGLTLLIVELIFIPGTTVVGVLGLIFAVVGVVISYAQFGNDVGLYVLIATLTITAVAVFFSFRSGVWSKFSLKSSIKSRVNEESTHALQPGDTGITRSALRPMGTAEFNNQLVEVRTLGQFVENGKTVKIISVEANRIVVEPTNQL